MEATALHAEAAVAVAAAADAVIPAIAAAGRTAGDVAEAAVAVVADAEAEPRINRPVLSCRVFQGPSPPAVEAVLGQFQRLRAIGRLQMMEEPFAARLLSCVASCLDEEA